MPAPANDNFDAATVLSGASGTVACTNVDATFETGEPDNDIESYSYGEFHQQTVWFRWTASHNGVLTIGVDEGTADTYDSTLEAFTGSTLAGLSIVVSDDDSGPGRMSLITDMPVTSGVTYHFRVDSWNYRPPIGADGTLTWSFVIPPPANDAFAARQVIDFTDGLLHPVTFDLNLSSLESGEQHTSGAAGSVWFETTPLAAQNLVLFDVPAGVEVVLFRGTATLADMLYRNTSNDSDRHAFTIGSGFTYFVKLQSTTATEAGTMNVRPFAWSDWITAPVILQSGSQHVTTMDHNNSGVVNDQPDEGTAWSGALAGPDDSGDYLTPGGRRPALLVEKQTSSGLGWRADYTQTVTAIDFAEAGGPLTPAGFPGDPSDFDDTLVFSLDYGADPASGNTIEYDSGAAAVAAGMGAISFLAFPGGSSSGGSYGSTYNSPPYSYDWDFHLNPVAPPSPIDAAASWPAPPSGGIKTIHLHIASPSGTVIKTLTGGTLADPGQYASYDTVSLLTSTQLALAIGPDAAMPAVTPESGSGDVFLQMIITPLLDVQIPIQYPRYKLYGPVTVPSVGGWQVGSVSW